MVKHESRKNKPILLVGNGINGLLDKEINYFDVDSLLKKSFFTLSYEDFSKVQWK